MIAARIIEEVKQIIEAGLRDVPGEQVLEIMPKINTAVTMYCVDKMLELTNIDDPPATENSDKG